jgi:hypothetical protein
MPVKFYQRSRKKFVGVSLSQSRHTNEINRHSTSGARGDEPGRPTNNTVSNTEMISVSSDECGTTAGSTEHCLSDGDDKPGDIFVAEESVDVGGPSEEYFDPSVDLMLQQWESDLILSRGIVDASVDTPSVLRHEERDCIHAKESDVTASQSGRMDGGVHSLRQSGFQLADAAPGNNLDVSGRSQDAEFGLEDDGYLLVESNIDTGDGCEYVGCFLIVFSYSRW